jgi:NADPH:quinone reductase-like Zn-dependent oxidoreductase
MKALFFKEHGDISRLQYGDLPEPPAVQGTVLVRVKACALNHLDLWVLRGWPGLKLGLPHIGGADIVGEIVEVGTGVSGWKKGQRVALIPGFVPQGARDEYIDSGCDSLSPQFQIYGENCRGGFAELVQAPAQTLLALPPEIDFPPAAAPLLVATTAWRMLKQRAALHAGETVLIVGAGGGLNSFCIWLAKDLGARVIALSSSAEKLERAQDFGADDGVNYREHPEWSKQVRQLTGKRGVDVVIDNVGGSSFQQSLLSLCRGGRLVTVGNTAGTQLTFDNRLVFGKQLSILGSTMGSMQDAREAIAYAWTKPLHRLLHGIFSLEDGPAAYNLLQTGKQFGKIVLLPG